MAFDLAMRVGKNTFVDLENLLRHPSSRNSGSDNTVRRRGGGSRSHSECDEVLAGQEWLPSVRNKGIESEPTVSGIIRLDQGADIQSHVGKTIGTTAPGR